MQETINYFIHNLKLAVASPLVSAYLAQRYVSGKSRPGWPERWGRLPVRLQSAADNRPRLWMHAVSAGEVVAAVPILRELRRCLPDYEIVFSVITPAGHEMASQQVFPYADVLFYFPFDLPWVVRKVVRQIRPQVFVSLESEMWPNLLHELKREGALTVLVNGRISERNFMRSQRFGRRLYRWMISNMDRLLMQSEADAVRVTALSGGRAEDRVSIIGNSKFDQEVARLDPDQTRELRRQLKLPEGAPVFVAGSTRSAEEEAEVIAAYGALRAEFNDLCLVIAPRHIARADELLAALESAGYAAVRKTRIADAVGPVEQIVLDTMGELANVYAVADFAFVGNSFPPVVKGGGQNLLQPLAHGKPVFVGPLTASIRSELALAGAAGVAFVVANGAELAREAAKLLRSRPQRQEIAAHAVALIAANRGVSTRYAEAIARLAGTREAGST
jgi:3-deoxy-D-manno-octulosonic-acid transferase